MKSSQIHRLLIFNGYTLTENQTAKVYANKNRMNVCIVDKLTNQKSYMIFGSIVAETEFISSLAKPLKEKVIPKQVTAYANTLPEGQHNIYYLNSLYVIVVSSDKAIRIYSK